ncbi:MAG: septum formation initiator family protein [Chloroflexi bacterium]|jgi:cell division protein FtsB|nr:septum formation initiator family protein [Chloroflexota bacterium]
MSEQPSQSRSAPVRTSSRPRSAPRPISNMQVVFGAILAISLLLAINFSGRIAAGRRISAQRQELLYSIETLQARATALRTELDFYASDAFVEAWARREGKMIRPNEVLVVPVPRLTTPTPILTPTPLPPEIVARRESAPSNFELWWQLFFDSPPPR